MTSSLRFRNITRFLPLVSRKATAAFTSETRNVATSAAAVDAANREISDFFGVDTPESNLKKCTSLFSSEAIETAKLVHLSATKCIKKPHLGRGKETPNSADLTHVDSSGSANMVDISQKAHSYRAAGASVKVLLGPQAFYRVKENQIKKGDVLTVSKIAGIMGAKQTASLLPLCHTISLSHVDLSFELREENYELIIRTTAKCTSSTGVEMEALTSAGIAALNVVDMVKAVTKAAVITDLQLDFKQGGKNEYYERADLQTVGRVFFK